MAPRSIPEAHRYDDRIDAEASLVSATRAIASASARQH
jgi:hypothetical protein